MSEVWRDIEGYEGLYQVSNQGRVKSLERTFIDKIGRERYVKECILKPRTDRYGYLVLNLRDGGKRKHFKVHRLVCQAFYENQGNKPDVNHINEDKTDNRACNLEWCTRRENINHGTRNERSAKKRSKQVGQYTLNGELVKVWQSTNEVERQTGFSSASISQAANGKSKQAHGYRWKYIERKEKNMKYTIYYSLPYDIHRYKMTAKDEDQLVTFLKMLRDEQAYGFEVVPEYTIARQ